ncbi:hypothetical protein MTBBW1_2910002 [Desulfamplus magnetovallimortis]|uniref:Uncharacterized protein n=1 Tax=Desulfamplus magnetovallimortis TaxID=1246637 RepID=A0A1W1HFK7_9BACT|nr:hypothetical protein MTBBW1_2910002 [Desulfamplus magnetovallimortis]
MIKNSFKESFSPEWIKKNNKSES